jgi:hypothetical protein
MSGTDMVALFRGRSFDALKMLTGSGSVRISAVVWEAAIRSSRLNKVGAPQNRLLLRRE